MPTASASPLLPVELLLSIFSHLRPHDLAQVCKANSHLRAVARPLFYHFGTFTKFGLHFPGASNPYPSLDVPEIGVTALNDSSRAHLFSQIQELTILTHTPSECTVFRNLEEKHNPSAVKVLRVECALRIMGYADWDPEGGDFTHTKPWPAAIEENYWSGCFHCEYPCHYLHPLLSSLRAEKVVFRDPPIGTGDNEMTCMDEYNPVREFVAVLHSEPIAMGGGCHVFCGSVRWGVRPFWCAPLVTVILWTGSSDAEWLPACLNAGHMTDAECDTDDSDLDYLSPPRYCDALESLWIDTGEQVALGGHCTRLRIVNAAASWKSSRWTEDLAQSVRRVSSFSKVKKLVQRGCESALRGTKEKWTGEVQFLSMEEWIALGEWEDVFSRKEMAPFLAKE